MKILFPFALVPLQALPNTTNATTSADLLPSSDHLDCVFHIRFIPVIPRLYRPLSFPGAGVPASASLVTAGVPFIPALLLLSRPPQTRDDALASRRISAACGVFRLRRRRINFSKMARKQMSSSAN